MKSRLLLIASLLLTGCELMQSGKGGVETTNGLSGVIKDPAGAPVANARVVLVPSGYDGANPSIMPAPETTATDARGRYRFEPVPAGTWNLESQHPGEDIKAWLPGLDLADGQPENPIADAVLKAPGALSIPFAERQLPENAVLFIPGTTVAASIVGKIDPRGNLVIRGLPEGRFPFLMAWSPDPDEGGTAQVCAAFEIRSADTTFLPALAAWSGSKTIRLDFTAAGAMPLPTSARPILIRLDSADLDFTQAGADGKDIRFTDGNGNRVHFQIEDWDASGRRAAIWVRFAPSGAKDSLVLHWGRRDALPASDGAAVFDTAHGIAAVWHLGETRNAAANGYKDAAAGGYHATGTAPSGDPAFRAVAGNGARFRDSGQGLMASMPAALAGGKSFSVTFWMEFQAQTRRQTILAFGEEKTDSGFHFLIRPDTTAQFGPFDFAGGALSAGQNSFDLAPHLGKWVFVATVYDAAQGRLTTYVNGTEAASGPLARFGMKAPGILKIGKMIHDPIAEQADFNGGLDEVRIYREALDADAIRFEYAIQRRD